MKRQILKALNQIKKAAALTDMRGTVELHYEGIHPDEWDKVLQSITEYKLYRHYVSVTDRLQVALLLD